MRFNVRIPIAGLKLTIIEKGLQQPSSNRTLSLWNLGASLLSIAIGYGWVEIQSHQD
ncbi:hypothetical protein [Trichothermofontia sp.]